MINPEQPERMDCPVMLAEGGVCRGAKCAAFRWAVYDPQTGGYWTPSVIYPTKAGAAIAAKDENALRKSMEQPAIEVVGVCGMVALL